MEQSALILTPADKPAWRGSVALAPCRTAAKRKLSSWPASFRLVATIRTAGASIWSAARTSVAAAATLAERSTEPQRQAWTLTMDSPFTRSPRYFVPGCPCGQDRKRYPPSMQFDMRLSAPGDEPCQRVQRHLSIAMQRQLVRLVE